MPSSRARASSSFSCSLVGSCSLVMNLLVVFSPSSRTSYVVMQIFLALGCTLLGTTCPRPRVSSSSLLSW